MVGGVHRKPRREKEGPALRDAPANTSQDSDSERRTKVAPRKHSSCTHFPKDRNCDICQRTTTTRAPWRKRTGEAVPRAEHFGDMLTADHKVVSEGGESRNNHRYAIVVQDLATQRIQSYPCKTKLLRDGKEFTKVSRAVRKNKGHLP